MQKSERATESIPRKFSRTGVLFQYNDSSPLTDRKAALARAFPERLVLNTEIKTQQT